ncbi:HD domain-containing protein [Actinosynnema sp. NPDC020468]|uniref:HD domain-containing protein n=1 Tax=Actinosynnema sp. NPDC020468 TaxID=3154488 RepID=UPI0033E93FD1
MTLEGLWHEAVCVLGGTPAPTDLDVRYAESHRGYHNADHVLAVVRDVEWLAEGLDARDRAVLRLAALAHDVVYDGKPGDDERASARWVLDHLEVPERRRVAELVLATIDHEADDEGAALLMDADLAVLGSEPAAYERYRSAVRAEYAHVPDEAWRAGRARVLEQLLARDPLYVTPRARDRWGSRAVVNLRAELSGLR